MSRLGLLLIVFLLLVASPALPIMAQGGDNACPALVEMALEAVGDACQGLGRNEACYGYNQVEATFWEAGDDLVFAMPADRVPLLDVQTIQTASLDVEADRWGVAVLDLQANLPGTLPGQVLTFMLMGDSSLENAVSPQEAAMPLTPVQATTTGEADLYRQPGDDAPLAQLPDGTRLQLIGRDTDGDWAEVLLTSGDTAWIAAETLDFAYGDGLDTLPVTDGDEGIPRYGPMQAFYFDVGFGAPTCNEAPDALVINSAQGTEIAFNINALEVRIGSTVVFIIVEYDGERVLVGVLLDGNFLRTEVNGELVNLTQAGQVFGVTLNAEGRVDENSRLVTVPVSVIESLLQSACHNAGASGLFEGLDPAACDTRVMFFNAQDLPLNASPALPGGGTTGGSTGSGSPGGPAGTSGTTTQLFPVYFCQHLGNSVFQWYAVEVLYQDGVAVGERVVEGPFMGDWLPGCPEGEERHSVCGNSITEPGEQCDPPNGETCDQNCQSILLPPGSVCGNRIVETGEQCDPPDGQTCDTHCQLIPEPPLPPLPPLPSPPPSGPVCGNGIVEAGESCDPPDGMYCDSACQFISTP